MSDPSEMLTFRVDAYRNGVFSSTAICKASKNAFDSGTLYWQREWKTLRNVLTYKATLIRP